MVLGAKAYSHRQWTRRALFFGVNALLAIVVYFLAIEPVRSFLAERADGVAERRVTLARYEAVAAQEQAVQVYARQVEDSNAQGELLAGASEGIINANLQARLKTLAEQSGASVLSVRMLPAKTVRNATLIGARLEVTGRIEALHALARSVESESPLLLVFVAALRNQMPLWDIQPTADRILGAQFDVYGGASAKESP